MAGWERRVALIKNVSKHRLLAFSAVCLAVLSLGGCSGSGASGMELSAAEQPPFFEASYRRYLDSKGFVPGVTKPAEDEINIAVTNFEASVDMDAIAVANGVRTGETGTIAWTFDARTAGFYNLEVSFVPERGTNSPISRRITLDGEMLHSGLRQISFNRSFTDEGDGIETRNGNEIRPRSVEIFAESSVFVGDSLRRSLDPFLFYLDAGKHTLSFESVKESMLITALRFAAAPVIPSYMEFISGTEAKPYSGENLVFQAERRVGGTLEVRRSLPSIGIRNRFFDPSLEPFHPYRIVFNTIGAESWRNPGEVIEWDIDVPEDGLYKLSFKGRQGVSRGVISYRNIRINGAPPFREAQSVAFPFSAVMRNTIPGGDEPWLFYFKKGVNTVSMEVVLGSFGMPYAEISESVIILNDLYRRIVQITGTVPEMFIDYEIPQKITDFKEILEREHRRLSDAVEVLDRITVEKGSNTTMVARLVEQIGRLILRPDNVTRELNYLRSNISSLATWMITISEMPLELDSFTLMAGDATPAPARANFLVRFFSNTVRFFASFFVNTTAVDSDTKADSKNTVTVWIQSGRDQAQLLRSLIDERFSPEFNIGINLQLVPVEVVIPSALAGVGPDVVLGLDQAGVLDFAMRNALVDISALEGFEKEKARFFPSAIEGISFQGKTFGLPETQNFLIMFYRRDILDLLGLTPPRTWEEFRDVIPVLHRHGHDVYVPRDTILPTMIVQKGGDLYLGAGNDYGIRSALLEEPAMRAFEELTDLFTAYKLPVAMDFNNRFRTGEVPLGLAEYTQFNTLELFAPEIRGLWSFELMPGILREDGSIDNRTVSTTTQTVILNAAKERDVLENAWTFMRWWLSTDTQTEFATGIEALLGTSARYSTANSEVLVRLPWAVADANRLLEQFGATRGIPPVPGNYMTTRMIGYAFNNVVAAGANPRETLFLNTKDIDSELTKKRMEFGLSHVDEGGF